MNAFPLRNDHLVFVLGAGFSVARGMPVLRDFSLRMRDAAVWCESNGRNEEAEAIKSVLNFRLRAAAAAYRVEIDLENVEELFSLASASSEAIAENVIRAIAATLQYCSVTNTEPLLTFPAMQNEDLRRVGKARDGNVGEVNLYDAVSIRLLQGAAAPRTSIISLNYDTVIESSLRRLGSKFQYGFTSDTVECSGYGHEGVPIYKLHGSINWGRQSGTAVGAPAILEDYEAVRTKNLLPDLIPPTWNKHIRGHLAEVWKGAIGAMATATKIVVIGFSMPPTDTHFKYLLAAGMQENISLREVVFVDPSPAVEERAAGTFNSREIKNDRVRFIHKRLADLIATQRSAHKYQLLDGEKPKHY